MTNSKKRILAIALLLAGWLSVDAFNVNGIYYGFVDKVNRTVKVSYRGEQPDSYKGEYTGDVTIPTTVIYNGVKYFVLEIDDSAFEDCPDLTSVTIPHTIEKIGYNAFSSCSGLTSIFIPNSVKEIGSNPFVNCSNLNLIEVEDWNPKYDSRNGCNAIIETSTNTLIVGCKNTIIPNSVITIGDGAFKDCTSLTTIDIPNSVTVINYYAFSGCTSLTTITIPQSVTTIYNNAFSGCTGLTNITIPQSVSTIYGAAFANCTSLTTINYNAKNCDTYIDEGEGGYYPIFEGCVALENLNIGKNVKNIPYDLFYDCPNLSSIVVDDMNRYYDSRNNCNAVIKTSTNTLVVGSIKMVIPATVKTIENGAFYGRGVESLAVEKGNHNYDSRNNCNAVIETSTSTLIVGSNNTIIPNSVQKMGDRAFMGRSRLKNIVIPISVKEIGYGVFSGCTGLESIIVEEGNRKYDSRNNCNAIIESSTNTLVVGCKNTKIPNTVTGIESGAFEGCTGLTSFSIPNSITNIDSYAFQGCNGLTSVFIPSSVASIGYEAFMDCKRLTTVNFNAVNCVIGCDEDRFGGPFSGCDALKTINIGNNVKYISSCLFYGCNLTTISIPNSVTRVGECCWDSLKKIIIPRGTRQKFKRIFPTYYHSKLVEQ